MESRSIFILQPGQGSSTTPRVDSGDETARGIEADLAFHLVVVKDNLIPRLVARPPVSTNIPHCHFDPVESFAYARFSTITLANRSIPTSIFCSSQPEKLSRILFSPPPSA